VCIINMSDGSEKAIPVTVSMAPSTTLSNPDFNPMVF